MDMLDYVHVEDFVKHVTNSPLFLTPLVLSGSHGFAFLPSIAVVFGLCLLQYPMLDHLQHREPLH